MFSGCYDNYEPFQDPVDVYTRVMDLTVKPEISKKKYWNCSLKRNLFRIFKENINNKYLPGRLVRLPAFLDLSIESQLKLKAKQTKDVWLVEIIS